VAKPPAVVAAERSDVATTTRVCDVCHWYNMPAGRPVANMGGVKERSD